MTDSLYVSFDRDEKRNETGLAVSRIKNNEVTDIIKMELDEQAKILYRLLTEQMTKAAIESLQVDPCEDAISRRAVMDIIHHYKNDRDSQLSDLTDGVCNLKPVLPKWTVGRWISVDEQLPEETGTYLVTLKFDDILYDSIVTSVAEYDNGKWDIIQLFVGNVPKIIYWMPLPEPYKAESEDKE